MAIKTGKQMRTTDVETQNATDENETVMGEATGGTQDSSNGSAGAPADASTTAPKRRGGPRGPRGPITPWGRNEDEIYARDAALVEILKSNKGNGSVRTASSVAQALSAHPAFEGLEVTRNRIKTRVDTFITALEADGKTPPAWLNLDKGRTASKPNLSLFEG
jgi:hypothetical protein